MSSIEGTTTSIEPIRVAVEVSVPPERAWEVFTSGIDSWWPGHTHSVAALDGGRPDSIVLEPFEGGEIYELAGSVKRHWARIHTWQPPHALGYRWHVNPENPPTEVLVTFEETPAGTRVEVVHSGWEAYATKGPETRASYGGENGWPVVMGAFEEAFR